MEAPAGSEPPLWNQDQGAAKELQPARGQTRGQAKGLQQAGGLHAATRELIGERGLQDPCSSSAAHPWDTPGPLSGPQPPQHRGPGEYCCFPTRLRRTSWPPVTGNEHGDGQRSQRAAAFPPTSALQRHRAEPARWEQPHKEAGGVLAEAPAQSGRGLRAAQPGHPALAWAESAEWSASSSPGRVSLPAPQPCLGQWWTHRGCEMLCRKWTGDALFLSLCLQVKTAQTFEV